MKVKNWWIAGIMIALFMASVLSLFASPEPDGLEKVAEDYGFTEKAEGQEVIRAPMPDYIIPGIGNEKVAASLAGFIGVLIILGINFGWARLLKR